MSIETLSFKERSLLFASLSKIAYSDMKTAKKQAKEYGFTTVEFYNRDGAQAYRFMNKTDLEFLLQDNNFRASTCDVVYGNIIAPKRYEIVIGDYQLTIVNKMMADSGLPSEIIQVQKFKNDFLIQGQIGFGNLWKIDF